MVESTAIYAFVITVLILYFNPFWEYAVKIAEKVPFSKVVFEDVEAPFHFHITLNLEPGEAPMETLFNINVDADLNFMMKTLLGGKIQEFLDKTVTAVSTGEIL